MNKLTQPTKTAEVQRTWHLVDAKGEVIGRLATKIALLLQGKSKPYFAKNIDCGDYVVVINSKEIGVTGKKETTKTYYRHSMYPGGFKGERLEELRARKPEDIVIHAVKGMLPQNKLRASMLKRLRVYADDKHEYEEKLKNKSEKIKMTVQN